MRQAAILFAEKGYKGTSTQDIADAVGLQRTSLYYYFKTKESLLAAMIEQVTVSAAMRNERISTHSGSSVLQRLGDLTYDSVMRILEHPLEMRLLDRIENELPAPLFKTYTKSKRNIVNRVIQLISDGIECGEVNETDPRVAAFAIIGMANWTAWWYKPSGALSKEEVARMMSRMAVGALARPNSQAGPIEVISGIRAELNQLEAQVSKLLD